MYIQQTCEIDFKMNSMIIINFNFQFYYIIWYPLNIGNINNRTNSQSTKLRT